MAHDEVVDSIKLAYTFTSRCMGSLSGSCERLIMCSRTEGSDQVKLKLKARVNHSDARTIRHALDQLPAKGSIKKADDEFVVEAEMGGTGVAARHSQRSYSTHDTQKCGAAGTDRDSLDDGSSGVEFRLYLP